MCNDYRNEIAAATMAKAFSQVGLPLRFTCGTANLEPRQDIRITETAPVVRISEDGSTELAQIRWSWPGPKGQPVFNVRLEGRAFGSGHCLIPADGFYEFTDPPEGSPKGTRKMKWLFTKVDEPWFYIAGLWRRSEAGDSFAMLTTAPGPDVAPIHDRQIVVLDRADWPRWLHVTVPAKELLRPSAAGALHARAVPTA